MSTKSAVSFYEIATVTAPNAGQEFSLRAPGSDACRLISVAFTLITSAVVANRRVTLLADDQTDVWGVFPASTDQAASATVRYGAFVGANGGGLATAALSIPLPGEGFLLQPGHRLRTSTANIDAGDAYSAIRALWQRFPQGPVDEWLPSVAAQIEAMG